ncbi:MAG: hypothetical protein KDN20_16470, partial [Verrucomicrobiae bacterium]|nr:hypothetical protein [Verrucomicrobiae bacterium]
PTHRASSFRAKEADEIWRSVIVAFIENRTSQFFGFRQSFLAKGLSDRHRRNPSLWRVLADK